MRCSVQSSGTNATKNGDKIKFNPREFYRLNLKQRKKFGANKNVYICVECLSYRRTAHHFFFLCTSLILSMHSDARQVVNKIWQTPTLSRICQHDCCRLLCFTGFVKSFRERGCRELWNSNTSEMYRCQLPVAIAAVAFQWLNGFLKFTHKQFEQNVTMIRRVLRSNWIVQMIMRKSFASCCQCVCVLNVYCQTGISEGAHAQNAHAIHAATQNYSRRRTDCNVK